MRRIMFITLCVIFVTSFIGNSMAQEQNLEKAKELWEKVIEAKGGRENLYAVKNLVVSDKSFSPSEDEEFQNSKSDVLYVLSGKWWAWTDNRPGFTLKIWQYDFEREIGYERSENRKKVSIFKPKKPQNLSKEKLSIVLDGTRYNNFAKEKFLFNQLIYLMETKWFQPEIKGMRRERVKWKKLDVIEVSFGRMKLEYFIDPKTYLPKRIRRSVWFERSKEYDNEYSFYLEDYIEVAGIKFPQTVKISKNSKTKTTYQVNVKYDENLFNKKPTFKYGSSGWKPRQ